MLAVPEVVLPIPNMPWLLEQLDQILSHREINKRFLGADYTMLHHHTSITIFKILMLTPHSLKQPTGDQES
jgi:hypothetical protein